MTTATQISPGVRKLLEGKNFANIATVMPDGSPQVTPVWVDFDGTHILVNTADGRQKPRNLRRDPRVAVSVYNQENPYSYVQVRGRVVDITVNGADAHIDKMAKKYMGQDTYPFRTPTEQRLILKIAPERVFAYQVED
jgi:PPOX class probable F420-dependent enzyme